MRSALSIVHPLHSLPSILAIEDIAEDVEKSELLDHHALVARLAVDPLATMRAIRLTCAPIQCAPLPHAFTLDDLVVRLGPTVGTGVFSVPAVGAERTRGVRRAWLRNLAVAGLAEQRRESEGPAAQRAAYLSALVTPKSRWLEVLAKHHNGGKPDVSPADWSRRWHLDAVPALEDFDELDQEVEALGFRLDETPTPGDDPVSQAVRDRLAAVGIDLELILEPDLTAGTNDGFPGFGGFGGDSEQSDLVDVAALTRSLLTCRQAHCTRAAMQLALQSAVTHLDFDRAFVVQASRDFSRAWVRTRADLSPLPFRRLSVTPSENESRLLARARQDGTVQMLVRDGNEGLCTALGADRALVTMFGESPRSTNFAVLDRAVRCRDLDFHRDGPQVAALASLLALLGDNLRLRLHQGRAERHARTDPLTGVLNRRAGMVRLNEEVSRSRRTGRPISAMMLDLDEFKQLNDQFGHQEGDRAIRLTADVLRRSLRQEDVLCRLGGEEFLIALPETDAAMASVIGTRLFVEIETAGVAAGLPLTASIGLAELQAEDDADSIVGRADLALFASKSRGRNRLSVDG
ncbi:MAG: GGDEF domain-containing protein [Planctomycetota bacterium]